MTGKKGRVIVVGDSHALYSYAAVHGAKIFMFAGCTMHRVARDGIQSLLPAGFCVSAADVVIVSCGDVDCRMHIKRQSAIKGWSIDDEIDDICKRFSVAVHLFGQETKCALAVSCIVPLNPTILSTSWSDEMTVEEATMIRAKMNSKLQLTGYPFIDFRQAFSNDDGTFKDGMSDNGVHVDPRQTMPAIDALNLATGLNLRYSKPPYPVHLLLETRSEKLARTAKTILRFPDKHIWRPVRNYAKRITGRN
ncbi:hypothetical protein [Agrobacterium rosae]|uniref:hypothetical protein n=1 Tax=Agrobacterium rosae TaxID=1972867 RepID=UPI0020339928|nr:hypothetical protein [Agrobacterium rosae]MCM2436319.1 hypothetical protein [Agrobacterium rosae]